ncbi:hypothetical protein PIB30_089675 [Stylosanthes scabra]|uniref:Uncharacterized protein n=1 Tax=Stylosanthes scabra TaxID=79078 RepID=A0ABU6TWE5_9FABA|nr:hypothetical protein [Stylosanthes scabra]
MSSSNFEFLNSLNKCFYLFVTENGILVRRCAHSEHLLFWLTRTTTNASCFGWCCGYGGCKKENREMKQSLDEIRIGVSGTSNSHLLLHFLIEIDLPLYFHKRHCSTTNDTHHCTRRRHFFFQVVVLDEDASSSSSFSKLFFSTLVVLDSTTLLGLDEGRHLAFLVQ